MLTGSCMKVTRATIAARSSRSSMAVAAYAHAHAHARARASGAVSDAARERRGGGRREGAASGARAARCRWSGATRQAEVSERRRK